MDFLKKIIEHKRLIIERKKVYLQALKQKVKAAPMNRYQVFKKKIATPDKIHLIAEIKKASPSKGLICSNFDVSILAKAYAEAGADALSILTEDKYFLGRPAYVKIVSENFQLPILRKDFILDEVQVYETFMLGASAVLLIVAILDDPQLKLLLQVAGETDMDCLVEVHDEQELERALKAGAEIIGINNRDLHTFDVDLKVSERLIPQIPKDKVIVVESGIHTREEVAHFQELGAHAVLIGETFLKEADVGKKVKELMGY